MPDSMTAEEIRETTIEDDTSALQQSSFYAVGHSQKQTYKK